MGGGSVPVWVRDEWSVPESTARADAQTLGTDSPVVTLFLPRYGADALKTTLANHAAAQEVVQSRAMPMTQEGQQARSAMQSRMAAERATRDGLVAAVLEHARVYQGGGNEIAEANLCASVKLAALAAPRPDNLFGLEIDARCVQIAAFSLALAAWNAGGYRRPLGLNIACSGIAVTGQLEDWTSLAGNDQYLRQTLERSHALFRQAPELGSLIDPSPVPVRDRIFTPELGRLAPVLHRALGTESIDDPAAAVLGETLAGVARAADLLSRRFTLVATNIPYLVTRKQTQTLRDFLQVHFPLSRVDLATASVERCRSFTRSGGSYALVTPQNWLFLGSYRGLRENLLVEQTWNIVARSDPEPSRRSVVKWSTWLCLCSPTMLGQVTHPSRVLTYPNRVRRTRNANGSAPRRLS
jgi:hypothetical protein